MKINIERIKDDLGAMMEVKRSIPLGTAEIRGQEINFIEPCELNLTVINSDEEYIITGKGKLKLELPCTRCLELFKMSFSFDFNEEVAKDKVKNNQLVLEDSLWEHIRVNLPMKTVCKEDCQGLCPGCGVNLNKEECNCYMHEVDPRMAKLKQLLDEE